MDHERAPWPPRRSEAERRSARCGFLYDLKIACRQGWGEAAFFHEEEKDLFRFRDGRFAFSREHVDWTLLRKRGRLKGL